MALGSDFSGVFDLTPTLETVEGRQALAQAILGRLVTPRGGLPEDPSYGFDLRNVIGSVTPVTLIEQRVIEQVLDEEEVEEASCTVIRSGDRITVVLRVVDGEGPFALTVVADALTVDLLLGET